MCLGCSSGCPAASRPVPEDRHDRGSLSVPLIYAPEATRIPDSDSANRRTVFLERVIFSRRECLPASPGGKSQKQSQNVLDARVHLVIAYPRSTGSDVQGAFHENE